MSAKHTPGPWKVVKAVDTWMVASCGDSLIIQSPPCHGSSLGAAEDDAARIVACVNAMEGIEDPANFRRRAETLAQACLAALHREDIADSELGEMMRDALEGVPIADGRKN